MMDASAGVKSISSKVMIQWKRPAKKNQEKKIKKNISNTTLIALALRHQCLVAGERHPRFVSIVLTRVLKKRWHSPPERRLQ